MRKVKLPFLIGCVCAQLVLPSLSRAEEVYIPEKFKGIILRAPEPIYPLGIERQTIFDQGVYRLTINQQTGMVDEVGVLNRCGDRRLDACAVMAFFQWKLKPGTLKQLDVPVTYDRSVRVLLKKAAAR